MTSRRCLRLVSFLIAVSCAAIARTTRPAPPAWPFYAFDNGAGRGRLSFDQQAQLLKDLGYDGIAFGGVNHIPEMLKALDARGLKMLSIYVEASVDPRKPPYDPGLKQAIGQLKGRGTQIWLTITGGKPSVRCLRQAGGDRPPRNRRPGRKVRPARGHLSPRRLLRPAGR